MRTYTVRHVGPWGLSDQDGELIASGKKVDVLRVGRETAKNSAESGQDACVEVVDNQERIVQMFPYYADNFGQEALTEDEEQDEDEE